MNAESTREALDVASLAGDILLASGAEIFRVEETIDRIARAYGVNSSDAFVLSSGIFLTAESGKKQEFARVRHIPLSAARLDKVTAVNQLSREIEEGLHMPKEAKAWLLDIQRMPDKPRWHQVLASGVGSACFCFLFGGDVVDSMVAFLSGFVLYFYLLYLLRGRMSKIATNISGGALVTLIAVFLYQGGSVYSRSSRRHLPVRSTGSISAAPGTAAQTQSFRRRRQKIPQLNEWYHS